jgi:cytochrome c biogenesis protein CcdA
MASRDIIEKGVNIALVLGFVALALGIGLWTLSILERFSHSLEAILVVSGLLLLIFGALAAKLFTKVGT